MMTTNQRTKVERVKLETCLTCPLCNKLFREATTISECLHTFCRKCIYKKITDEDLHCCPICNVDLGVAPREKLRADNYLQDLRDKIFSRERKMAKESEALLSAPLPTKRKEKSLSSFGVGTPRLTSHSGVTVRRAKSMARNIPVAQESTLCINEPHIVVEDDKQDEDCCETDISSKIAQLSMQNSPNTYSSTQHMPNKVSEDTEPWTGTADLRKPLSHLVDTTRKTKSKFIMQGDADKPVPEDSHANEAHLGTPKVKENGNNLKVHDDGNGNVSAPAPSGSVKPNRSRRAQKRKASVPERLNVPEQTVVDTDRNCNRRSSPIWLSLVAADNQEGDASLPQISSCYLRVKDGSLPISYIKRYLMRKLDLASETEVEVSLGGQPLVSTLQLHQLVDFWLHTLPTSETINTSVGSTAENFVMVLSYCRKVQLR